MTKRKLSYLQGSGSPGTYLLPAEDHRLNRAGLWTPAAAAAPGLLVRGGMAPGNGAGVVTATAGGVNIAAGTCAVPGSVTAVQGVYECTWDASEFRAAPAASASTYRQILVVCHVYDSLNGDTKDDWDLEVVLGQGAATLAAAVVPAAPANSVVLATGSVDSAGNVSVVPTGAAQVARGGILPVTATDTANGAYVGQYRDHPTLGLQRWTGAGWVTLLPDTGWVTITALANANLPIGASGARYRSVGAVTTLQIDCTYGNSVSAYTVITTLPVGSRPKQAYYFPVISYGGSLGSWFVNTNGDVATSGQAWTSTGGFSLDVTFLNA